MSLRRISVSLPSELHRIAIGSPIAGGAAHYQFWVGKSHEIVGDKQALGWRTTCRTCLNHLLRRGRRETDAEPNAGAA
jgi:hypothetical protein